MSIRTSNVELKAKGKDFTAYLAEPENGGPGILLLHAWWGLKPFFKQVCDRLAEQGFVVLAPDLRQGQVAKTVEEAEALMKKSDSQLTGEIVLAAKDYLLGLPERKGERIGVIGYSMGAAWALVVASHVPDQVAATVLYYGVGEVDVNRLQTAILGHYSDVDEWEDYAYVQDLEKKMKAAGVDVEFHTYSGKPHWFVEEDRPEYDRESADLAWSRTLEFLKAGV